MSNELIKKLTSRKLWVAIAGFVAGLIVAFGGAQSVADTVSGCIMSGASVIGYMFAEGLVDAANASSTTDSTITSIKKDSAEE